MRGIKGHVAAAATMLAEKQHKTVILKGCGHAVTKTLRLHDLLRHGIEGLHSQVKTVVEEVSFESRTNKDDKRTRAVPSVEIILTMDPKAVTPSDPGYAPPVDPSEITPLEIAPTAN
jgi:DNA-binding protein